MSGLERKDTTFEMKYRSGSDHGPGFGGERGSLMMPEYKPATADETVATAAVLRHWESSEDLGVTLHQLARDGDAITLKRLINQISKNRRRTLNALDENGISPLHYAARYNHLAVVKMLVDSGADVNVKGEGGMVPLHFACKFKHSKYAGSLDGDDSQTGETPNNETVGNGTEEQQESVILYLESKGADVNRKDIYGVTPLHMAAIRDNDIAASELLSIKTIQVDACDGQMMTPLHMACTHGSDTIADMLIKKGSQLRATDEELGTPLHAACTEGHLDIVKLLFEAGEGQGLLEQMLTDVNNDRSTPLHLSVDSGYFEIVELCLSKGANVNCHRENRSTPLHAACVAGNLKIVELLLQKGAHVNSVNADRATPLHRACSFNRYKIVEHLLERGAKIEARDKDNFTPLLIAASSGHSSTIKILLGKRANIAAIDKHDKTALFWAAEENKPEALQALLEHKMASKILEYSDRYDNTALHVAAENGYLGIVRILLNNGAELDWKNEDEETPIHVAAANGHTAVVMEFVKREESTINDEDENSNTPLHKAATAGHAKTVRALIDAGADIESRNQQLWTPLDCAASKGWVKTAYALLENDSPVDPTDKAKVTPLHLAASSGHVDMVKLLLEWKADLSLINADQKNSLDLAIESGHDDVAEAIISHPKWRDAMCSESVDPVTGGRTTPIRKLIKRMPDVAIKVFNNCLIENDKPREHRDYCITFDYELLDDMFSRWGEDISGRFTKDNLSESGSDSSDNSPFKDNGTLRDSATPYTTSSELIRKNHPLVIMVRSKREQLLGHPLVTSLLNHKWSSYGRFFYYSSLLFYLLFLTVFTGYLVVNPPPFYFNVTTDADGKGMVVFQFDGNARWMLSYSNATFFLFGEIGHWLIIGLAGINLLREVVQIYHQKLNYLDFENLLEWCVYGLAILFVAPISPNFYPYGDNTGEIRVREAWQWQCGAAGIFLAWINLILFIRKFPQLGIYVVMFTDILKTFAKFVVLFILFIIAFALAFYALLMNQSPFNRIEYSLVKTFVMMIGEFEFDSIFHTQTYLDQPDLTQQEDFLGNVYYEGITYVIFVVFVVIMSIIIMNLLVGLAVDDIKEVQEQAKLQRLAMQVDLAMDVQEALPSFIWRQYIIKTKRIYPNRFASNIFTKLYASFRGDYDFVLTEAIESALNPEKGELAEISQQQEVISDTVANLKYRMKQVKSQNDRMERMLQLILDNSNLTLSEADSVENIGE
ncbi:transient receptor potential cation channel subfamily A member 1 homolog isoform X1 [Lytechinus variegatus]|uniref:transient receptor potential cation channel subfamily A member 1 homolog isoform X1 n=1 Tax=Lytechinus variegatus TaxID=7654 RepID=UPI001BB22084|nr:transient receptor potential cation channel subfamily A member 1 homolog isoform X1 [Lytechinus variegatus]XP_041463334.1 transient receptor potential cation channel subfamily A member 1 homolog isoform X1 [Lytechinus variegatus]